MTERLDNAAERSATPAHTHRPSLLALAPVMIAMLSLGVAIYGLVAARVDPEVILTMPDRVRVANGPDGAWLYLQPRFVNTGRNDRVEIVTSIDLQLVAPDGERRAMRWDEQGTWVYDPATRSLTWTFQADPAPLAVSRTAPQAPTGLFIAPDGWSWQAGAYRIELTAERQTSDEPLTGSLTFDVSSEAATALSTSPGMFLEVPAGGVQPVVP